MRHVRVRSGKDSSGCLLLYSLGPLRLLCLLGNLPDRRNNSGIGGAAAEIAAHALADLLIVEDDVLSRQISAHHAGPTGLDLAQHADRRAELSRGTVATLKGVVCDERLLEGVQVVAIGRQPLDGDDLGVLVRDGEGQAAIDASPVEQDGAGAALPVVAALLGAGESEPLAQRIQQRGAGINGKPVYRPVHPQRDLKIHNVCLLWPLLVTSRRLDKHWLQTRESHILISEYGGRARRADPRSKAHPSRDSG